MGRKGVHKSLVFVDALVETGAKAAVAKLGATPEDARALMVEVARAMCWQFSRQFIYVPVDMEFELTERDARMWSEYGQDGPDGARKYTAARAAQIAEAAKLTTVHVYRIFRLCQRRETAKNQHHLPGFEPADDPA